MKCMYIRIAQGPDTNRSIEYILIHYLFVERSTTEYLYKKHSWQRNLKTSL